jgi:predicted chitinase
MAGDWNGRDLVTIDELRQIYGDIPDEAKVVEGLPALNTAMLRAGITTPARKAAFLATLRNESGFRYDAVEVGNDSRYRGRGYIQLTGRSNYESAGEFLELDLVGEPDLAVNGLASPAIAAWYWTVARNINVSADALDMAAVNIAVGFAPTERRDAQRCSDFQAALRYYSGSEATGEVNCDRTAEARLRAFSAIVPWMPGASGAGASPAATVPPVTAIPAGWTPPSAGSPAPPDPEAVAAETPVPAVAPQPVPSTTAPAPTASTAAVSTAVVSTAPSTASSTDASGSSIAPDGTSTTTLVGG